MVNVDKLRQKIKERGISLLKLSKDSKVGYATLYDIVSGKSSNPRVETLKKIATALGEQPGSFI